jgi:NAD+ diphosphatase
MSETFIPAIAPPDQHEHPVLWFAFCEDLLLIRAEGVGAEIPLLADFSELGLTVIRQQYLGALAGRHCYSVELESNAQPPAGMAFENLRRLYSRLDEQLWVLAGRAAQIVNWDRTHQFCGRCGAQTAASETERARNCPACGLQSFPRLSPAVIVAITRGREVLLSRSSRFPAGMYSVLAGFVEPGESLEEAVEREVKEEVGVSIRNIRYFGSQPWPFPHSLMIGFTAEYAGGELQIDATEIEDAGWYTIESLPAIPPRMSIARQLIDWFIAQQSRLK